MRRAHGTRAPMERFGSREHSSRPPGNRSGMMKLHPQLTQEGRTFKLRSLWPTMSPNLCSLNVRSSGDIPRKRGFRQIQRTRFPTSISSAVIVGIAGATWMRRCATWSSETCGSLRWSDRPVDSDFSSAQQLTLALLNNLLDWIATLIK